MLLLVYDSGNSSGNHSGYLGSELSFLIIMLIIKSKIRYFLRRVKSDNNIKRNSRILSFPQKAIVFKQNCKASYAIPISKSNWNKFTLFPLHLKSVEFLTFLLCFKKLKRIFKKICGYVPLYFMHSGSLSCIILCHPYRGGYILLYGYIELKE